MTNKDIILKYLKSISPMDATITEIETATGVSPHAQVYQKVQELLKSGLIIGWREGRTWHFTAISNLGDQPEINEPGSDRTNPTATLTPTQFEQKAREVFSGKFNTPLQYGRVSNVRKEWDLVSEDGSIVGDAKYYTLVGGVRLPPAKFATIAEHVWLLEKISAKTKFLVFGNQIAVPKLWLGKYANLVNDVLFYFLEKSGKITQLN